MPSPSSEPGLHSATESVISKQALIDSVLTSLREGRIDEAASLYHRSKEDIGYELMNDVAGGDLAASLAKLFVRARDYYKAAQVFEKMEMKHEAAVNFEKAGAFGEAAELFANLGDMGNAAAMLERGGSYGRAAPLFEQEGQWLDAARNYEKAEERFLAGRAFAQGGDRKKALACLQKVTASDDAYAEAVSLLGPILEELGFQELALQKYEEAVGGEPVQPGNLSAYYRLARAHQDGGQLERAKQLFAKILEFDLSYEDVQERYRALKNGPASPGPALAEQPAASTPTSDVVVMHEDRSAFDESVLFDGLTFDEMRSVLEMAETRTFKKGELILREGKPFPGLVVVRSGELAVGMKLGGKDIRLATFGAGDHLGEMTVQGDQDSRVTAVATSDGDCIIVPGANMRALLERNPRLSAKLVRNLMAALDLHLNHTKEIIRSLWKQRN